MDKAAFPRDKVCAGWITPEVVNALQIDVDEYRNSRTCQPITAFRIGIIGDRDSLDIAYRRPVSFGIRRCEFDHYLLERAGARVLLGTPVTHIRRDGAYWVVNEAVRTPMLVGAGGHFCPVSRLLNGHAAEAPVVAAQEAEFVAGPGDGWQTDGEHPELYFCDDLRGYGWCFRKGDYVNVGFGRFDAHALPKATARFVEDLRIRRRIPAAGSWRWRGHAYLVAAARGRNVVDDGVMLAGDAAGLAFPRSGEGIWPAIESGLMAASTILDANGCYRADRLMPYTTRLRARFGVSPLAQALSVAVPQRIACAIARRLLRNSWFARHVVLDRWFLHAG